MTAATTGGRSRLELPRLTLAPLRARLDHVGIVEHAIGSTPTARFGHCTDDAGRALGLATELGSDRWSYSITRACLRQLAASQRSDGRFELRLDEAGRPTDDPPSDDSQARAAWGLAHTVTASLDREARAVAARMLAGLADFASPHARAAAHAAMAGIVLLERDPDSYVGARLLDQNAPALPRPGLLTASNGWLWPEPRLTYGNGLIVEALLAVGAYRRDDLMRDDALALLGWLVDTEMGPTGWFSFTPTSGRGPGDGPGFDQQPIEAWAIADACRRAHALTDDPRWLEATQGAAAWFLGANDNHVPVWDSATGAAYDGLTPAGVNRNQGTESTMAWIATQLAVRSAERHHACASGASRR